MFNPSSTAATLGSHCSGVEIDRLGSRFGCVDATLIMLIRINNYSLYGTRQGI